MQHPQAKLKAVTRLLASWPSAVGEGDEQLRNYLLAVEDYLPQDVEAGVVSLIKGNAPGVNPNFVPSPAAVGAEVRRMLNLRLDSEHREKLRNPALLAPEVVHDAESRYRVQELVANTVAKLTEGSLKSETEANRRAMIQRTNKRFDAERGFTVGDPDGDEAAA